MKIIKDGKFAKQVTCKYCECIYKYNGKDVIICFVNTERKYVECPQCGEKHYLKNQGEK